MMPPYIIPEGTSPEHHASRRLQNPIHTERHVNIICIGAGPSGLLLAYKIQRHFQNYSLTVFEKNAGVGGTWYEHKYPGVACDVPAHNYTFSFEPNPNYSSVYASGKEILDYFDSFADKYHLKDFIKTQHQVVGAYWNDEKAGYDVKVRDLGAGQEFTQHCDILINACGLLNKWKWPDIPGLDTFGGTLMHTSDWDDSVDLAGKNIGLIGNGSTGVQILPQLQPLAGHLTTFIREPTWISPAQGFDQRTFTPTERADFANKPHALLDYRKSTERGLSGQFGIFLKDTQPNNDAHAYITQQMREKLGNPRLEELLIPTWAVGCRRFTPGVGYLEALVKENVTVVVGEITSVTPAGALTSPSSTSTTASTTTSGPSLHPLDILICATGFDTSFVPRFPVISPTGTNLQDLWRAAPESYLGLAAPGFPNYFLFLGPNSPVGNGPLLSAIEAQADYMLAHIDRFQTRNIRSFAPSPAAVRDFIEYKNTFMPRAVWSAPCRSWYKQHSSRDGPVIGIWPGSTLHYIEAISTDLRLEDWDVQYHGNRFAWLGNGFSQAELDSTADWGWYVREVDVGGGGDDGGGRRRVVSKSGTVVNEGGMSLLGKQPPKRVVEEEGEGEGGVRANL